MASVIWDQPYHRLPEGTFWQAVSPSPVESPRLLDWNAPLACVLGVESMVDDPTFLRAAAAGAPMPTWRPIAQVYAGHQFGQWAGQLGDGRGLYLGVSVRDGAAFEWHLKGAGSTPYSRFGDGRAVLRSTLREYLGSEFLHAAGVPSTRALAVVGSDTPVRRETVEPAATLIRIAKSHLRIGHFEHFYYSDQGSALSSLIEFALMQLDPDLIDVPDRVEQLFVRCLERSAALVAHWMALGFVHGVMNTDNTALSGETLDYGPYGFVSHYDAGCVLNHTDAGGRYAFGQQPAVMHWNLARFAETLTPYVSVKRLSLILDGFAERYRTAYRQTMAERLAMDPENPALPELIDALVSQFSQPGTLYPEVFGLLHGVGRHTQSDPERLGESFRQLQRRWAGEVEPDRRTGAAQLAPQWMLSHWLLQAVIERVEGGDEAVLPALREAIQGTCDASTDALLIELSAAMPAAGTPCLLSCSS